MRTLICDIEADGLLDTVSKVFCIGAVDADTKEEFLFRPAEIEEGLKLLDEADRLVFHNHRYDCAVLEMLHGRDYWGKTIDTMLMAKIINPFLKKIKKEGETGFYHAYSLGAFGQRFKFPKGDHTDFTHYTPAMGEYCVQDCRVTLKLYEQIVNKVNLEDDWVRLEHNIARVQQKAVNRRVYFDTESALKLYHQLDSDMKEIAKKIVPKLGYAFEDKIHNLKKDGSLSHYAVKLLDKLKIDFPDMEHPVYYNKSRTKSMIRIPTKVTLETTKFLKEKLLEMGWEPTMFTEKGAPKIADKGDVCPNLLKLGGWEDVGHYFVMAHRKNTVNGYIERSVDNMIPSDADTVGAVTGRMTHKGVANVPSTDSFLGSEMRALFGCHPNRTLIGADLAGIEARLLAHFMNDEEFTQFISAKDADIHTFNQEKVGLPSRGAAKTFYYALLYGAGAKKIGETVGGGAAEGEEIKQMYFEMYPGLKETIDVAMEEASKGFVRVLGGRPVKITKSTGFDGKLAYDTRKALNSLLQGSGATYFKQWAVTIDRLLVERNLDATIIINYHDEVQIDSATDIIDEVKEVLHLARELTDEHFDVNCPNDIDIKVGKNWHDTH